MFFELLLLLSFCLAVILGELAMLLFIFIIILLLIFEIDVELLKLLLLLLIGKIKEVLFCNKLFFEDIIKGI
jgi:hypothetical protein